MNVLVQDEKKTNPRIAHEEECISCGHCVSICPNAAVIHNDFPIEQITEIKQDIQIPPEQLMELLKSRRSIRALRDRAVEKELIEQVVEGARFAPTALNIQSTEYIVIQDKEILKRIVELTVQSQARQIAHDAPVLIFFHADINDECAEVNATLALHNAALISHCLGLGSFYAGYITEVCQHDDDIPKLLSLPGNHRIYGALAIGYPKLKFKKRMDRKPAKITWG
jgi:nitroreductase